MSSRREFSSWTTLFTYRRFNSYFIINNKFKDQIDFNKKEKKIIDTHDNIKLFLSNIPQNSTEKYINVHLTIFKSYSIYQSN